MTPHWVAGQDQDLGVACRQVCQRTTVHVVVVLGIGEMSLAAVQGVVVDVVVA